LGIRASAPSAPRQARVARASGWSGHVPTAVGRRGPLATGHQRAVSITGSASHQSLASHNQHEHGHEHEQAIHRRTRTRRTNPTHEPDARTRRTNPMHQPDAPTRRTNPTHQPDAPTRRANPNAAQVKPFGETHVFNNPPALAATPPRVPSAPCKRLQ
jgi:hypothetical protein